MSLKDIQKLYEKFGKKFGISIMPQQGTDDHVMFSSDEWLWLKDQNLTQEQFDYIWNTKRQDFRAQIIPDEHQVKGKTLADQFVPEINKSLREKIEEARRENKWIDRQRTEEEKKEILRAIDEDEQKHYKIPL